MPPVFAGACLFVFGLSMRSFAKLALRRAGVTDDQFFFLLGVERYTHESPYNLLPHPCYTGSLLMIAGIGVMLFGLQGVALALPAWPFYADRIGWERKMRSEARKAGVDGA